MNFNLFKKVLVIISLVLVLTGMYFNFNYKEIPTALILIIIVYTILMDKIDNNIGILIIFLVNVTNIIIAYNTNIKTVVLNGVSIAMLIGFYIFEYIKRNEEKKQINGKQ